VSSPTAAASREARRAALRSDYASRLAPHIEALSQEQKTLMVGMLPIALAALAGWGTAIFLLVRHDWPDAWWRDTSTWQVLGLAAVLVLGTRWVTRWLDGGRSARFHRSTESFERDVLPRVFASLRPRASYKKGAALDRGWVRRSALVGGANEYTCKHLVRWTVDGIRVQMARVDAFEVYQAHGDTRRTVVVRGVVAIAALPAQLPGHVRVARRDSDQPAWDPLPGHMTVTPAVGTRGPGAAPSAWLDEDFEATTDRPAAAALVLTPVVIETLNQRHAEGRPVRMAVAHGELFVVLERWAPWFGELAGRLDAERYVEMGEFMNDVEIIARDVSSRLTSA
jgi:hypothetical protein